MLNLPKKLCFRKALLPILLVILAGIILFPILKEVTTDLNELSTTCKNGNSDKAISACTKIINSDTAPKDTIVDALLHRQRIFYRSSRLDEALLDTEQLIKLRPQISEIHLYRANIFEFQNENLKAAEAYAQAAKWNTDKEEKANLLAFSGSLYHAAGQKKLAQQQIDLALQIDPESIQAFDMKNHITIKEGHIDQALKAVDKKLEAHPFDTGWMYGRALIKMLQHNYDGANEDLKEALSLDQRDPYLALLLYLVQSKQGTSNPDDIKKQSERFGSATWPAPVFKYLSGEISEEQLRQTIPSEIGYPRKKQRCEALFYIAEHSLIIGQKEKAISIFKEAITICPPQFIESSTSVGELQTLQEQENAN